VSFAAGIALGAFIHQRLSQVATMSVWNDSEETTRARMYEFQKRLDNLEKEQTPDTAEKLSKQMEAQRGIEDILIKYREAQGAKYTPFVATAGALVGAIISGIVTWQIARRKTHDVRDE